MKAASRKKRLAGTFHFEIVFVHEEQFLRARRAHVRVLKSSSCTKNNFREKR
jgi:hypothetical protein